EAVEYCQRLNAYFDEQSSEPRQYQYRLPSEAEWEYACRTGSTTPFHFGSMITTEVANYNGSAYNNGPTGEGRGETTPVTEFNHANVFGLSDMHGNVWEWCLDPWHDNYEGAPPDGDGRPWLENPSQSNRRVIRGGSWGGNPGICRSAFRFHSYPGFQSFNLGFRVVLAPP
ncbi:MAG: formylglycine-generating enzyme family protein, partial [Leptolyngbyaceae bacterium]|nr:formylglycine-generating enzyme family protein [Leptolyngbyaceae bacterium]